MFEFNEQIFFSEVKTNIRSEWMPDTILFENNLMTHNEKNYSIYDKPMPLQPIQTIDLTVQKNSAGKFSTIF